MRIDELFAGAFLVLCVTGCGGASLILKPPIVDRCSSAGLKGCDQITEGVIAWVEGKKDEGRDLIERGAAKNAPKELQTFSAGLRLVAAMPGMDSYAQDLKSIADVLEDKAPATTSATVAASVQAPGETTSTKSNGVAQLARARAGVVGPSNGTDCTTSLGPSRCQRAMIGPAIVTTLVFGGRCGVPLAVVAGDFDHPHWQVTVPAKATLGLTALELPLAEGERLTVAADWGVGAGPECEVMWGATRVETSAAASDAAPNQRR